MLLIAALVFLSCTFAVGALLYWITPTKTENRLRQTVPSLDRGAWTETIIKLTGRFARLSTPNGDWETSPLRIRLLNAGIRQPDAGLAFYGAKSLVPLLFAAVAFALLRGLNHADNLTLLLYVGIAALVGLYLPNLLLLILVSNRQEEIFQAFPDAADLLLVCVEAGLGLDASLTKVAEEITSRSPATAEELLLTNLEIRAGVSREKALKNLALRTGIEEIRIFASMLTQADKFGTSVGDCLRVFSDDLRHKRQVRAEEKAAKIPVKILIPLVLFIFPAIIMVIMGPVVIQITRTLLPMLGGNR